MSKKTWVILGLLVAVFVAAYLGSPYYAVHSLKNAVASGDTDALEASVDFPKVRENLKSQMTIVLTEQLANDPKMKDNPFAGLGAALMPAIIDKAVAAYVTPEGISRLVKGGKPGQANAAKPSQNVTYTTEYSGLDRFRVHTMNAAQKQKGPTLVLERQGIVRWKLVKIELPEELFKRE